MKEKLKKICKKFPIEISIQNYKLIFIFIFPVFGVAHNRMRDKYLFSYHEYFNILIYYISYTLSFIPLIIYLILNRQKARERLSIQSLKSINDDLEIKGDMVTKQLTQEEKKQKKINLIRTIIFFIVLCSISLAYNHFNFESFVEKKTIGLAYKIPEYFLLSYFILRYKYHIHHYIPLIINTLSLIAKYILTIIQAEAQEYIGKHVWFYFLFSFTFCTLLVIGKYYMDKYEKPPYLIMFIIGIVMGFILISIAIIKYLVTSDCQIFTGFSENVNSTESILWFLGDVFTQFLYNLGFWITVYYFTPCHTIISENIMEIMYYIYDYKGNEAYWIDNKFYWNFWLMPVILVINFICSLIFNEIIILKFCKLDYYTKIRIQERERKDSQKMNMLIDSSLDEDSSRNSLSNDNFSS
jgi:hypothetical protein